MLTRLDTGKYSYNTNSVGAGKYSYDTNSAGTGKYSYDLPSKAWMKICDAEFGQIFPWRLEYNCPVHENWNIVHTGMLIPEVHQIYVCSDNCLRGVVLTADEMGAIDRISSVMPTENEVVTGKLEEVTIEGVSYVINRLPHRPKAVELFLVCMHHQIGVDERYIYDSLEKRFPDIYFMPCWMDPIMQKVSLTPEQKERKSMMLALYSGSGHADSHIILSRDNRSASTERADFKTNKKHKFLGAAVLGDNLRLPDTSDISRMLALTGYDVEQVQDKNTFEEYCRMGESSFFITRSALSVYGLKALAKRDNKKYLYMPPAACDDEIEEELKELLNIILEEGSGAGSNQVQSLSAGHLDPEAGESLAGGSDTEKCGEFQEINSQFNISNFIEREKRLTKEAFKNAKNVIGDTEITLDYLCFPRPLSFARRLLTEGFNVTTVFLDGVSPEEKDDFEFLKENYPDLILHSTNHVLDRYLDCAKESDVAVAENMKAKASANENVKAATPMKMPALKGQGKPVSHPVREGKILALGPKAAFFSQTDYFVNWIENDGNFGFDGLRKLCDEMILSFETPKDRRDLVQRKGLNNPSTIS